MANHYVDCDGHVMESADEIIRLVGEPFKTTGHMNPRRVLPSPDRFPATGYQDTTFAEAWLGIPPSGEKIRMRYMDFWRIETDPASGERKLAENLVLIDILGVFEQCGYEVNKVLKFIGSKQPEFSEDAT